MVRTPIDRRFRTRLGIFAVGCFVCFVQPPARADVTLQLVATDPPSPAILGKWDKFYVRVSYTTDRQIFVRAYPFFAGKAIPGMSSGAMPHDPGSGEAIYWVAFTDARKVDSIVIKAEDVSGRKTFSKLTVPMDLSWTDSANSTVLARPEWVDRMEADQNRRIEAQSKAYADRRPNLFEDSIFFAAALSVPGYFVMQVWLLFRLRGSWRIATAIPLVPMFGILVYTVLAAIGGSNLFPIFLLFTAPLAFLYLLVLLLVSRLRPKPVG